MFGSPPRTLAGAPVVAGTLPILETPDSTVSDEVMHLLGVQRVSFPGSEMQRRREELKSSYEYVHQAELGLHDGLRTLSACLRQLNRIDEAAAADDEAAALAQYLARPSGHVPPDPAEG